MNSISAFLTPSIPFIPRRSTYYHHSTCTFQCNYSSNPTPYSTNNNNSNNNFNPSTTTRQLLETLRTKLSAAVARQDFSEAASLRDQITQAESSAPDELSVTLANDTFYTALRNGDVDAMSSIWMPEDNVSCAFPLGGLLVGFDNVINSWSQIFIAGAPTQVDVTILNVQLSRNIAWVICKQNITAVRGSVAVGGERIATNIFQKRRQKWCLVHHHASPVVLSDQQQQTDNGQNI